MDEASQITLPTSLGPLRFADIFVLIGDHYQLPPLVRSKAAKEGLEVSLFRKLSHAQMQHKRDEAQKFGTFVALKTQYRMCEDIMMLSNELVYKNALVCGNDTIASGALTLSRELADLCPLGDASHRSACWLRTALQEECVR